jgi:hypothetical protein
MTCMRLFVCVYASLGALTRCCPVHVCTCHPCAAYVPTAGLVGGPFGVSAWVRVDSATPSDRVLLHVFGSGTDLLMWYVPLMVSFLTTMAVHERQCHVHEAKGGSACLLRSSPRTKHGGEWRT